MGRAERLAGDAMSLWDELLRQPARGRFALQRWIASECAKIMRTRAGPDDDVVINGRLVSVSSRVPIWDSTHPPTDAQVLDAVRDAAVDFAREHGQ